MRSLNTEANHLDFNKPISYLLLVWSDASYLLKAASRRDDRNTNNGNSNGYWYIYASKWLKAATAVVVPGCPCIAQKASEKT